jgi:hypothetical protein
MHTTIRKAIIIVKDEEQEEEEIKGWRRQTKYAQRCWWIFLMGAKFWMVAVAVSMNAVLV